ncbi:hypothetical protein D3C78_1338820 [compost metagenome]
MHVLGVCAIERQHVIEDIHEISHLRHLEHHRQVFDTNRRVITANLKHHIPTQHQGRSWRPRQSPLEQAVEVQAAGRTERLSLVDDPTLWIDGLDIASADGHLGMRLHISDLPLYATGQHDVVGSEGDEIDPLGTLQSIIQRAHQALILLLPEVEAVLFLEALYPQHTVIARTIVDDQQFYVAISLLQHTLEACLDIRCMVVRRHNDCD